MRRLPLLMLLGVFGCRGHSGFHSFSGGSSSFHSSSSVSHAGSGGGSFHSSYRAPSSTSTSAGTVSGFAETAVRLLQTAAEIALESAANSGDAPPEEDFSPAPPVVETPVTEVVWANVASVVARLSDCSVMSTVGVGGAILHRNTTLAFYVVGTGDALHPVRPIPEDLRLVAEIQGPARLAGGSMDGNRLIVLPNGPLGGVVHIEVINSATGTRLELDVPTEDTDAPCR